MTWRVLIAGERPDLECLSKSFTDDDLRVVADGDNYFLESTKFEGAIDSDEVLKLGTDLLAILSGVARLAYGARTSLKPDHIHRIRADGRKEVFVNLTAPLHFRVVLGKVMIHTADGNEVAVEYIDPARTWAETADKDKAVAKALRLFGADANDWGGLYKLFEVVKHDVGDIKNIVDAGWATMGALKRFKHTANSSSATGDSARHGEEKTQPPKNPMVLSEARSLIELILHSWLQSKRSG